MMSDNPEDALKSADRIELRECSSLSLAPMMDWTDRHFRYFLRRITRKTLFYTEMVTTGAILHGDAPRFLDFHADEHPLALQLGGSDPADLARCAWLGEQWGYDEINLNVGCPSDRVQSGRFGACLMAEPRLVADCIAAMTDQVGIAVTVKHRIGIDNRDSYGELVDFVGTIANAGCRTFIVHARKAWLKGLSPKQNREIPPLRYEIVEQLKGDFPHLAFVLNGGVVTLEQALEQLSQVDGVMIGREAYHNPWIFSEADALVFEEDERTLSRADVVQSMLPYLEKCFSAGIPINRVTRHMLGLYHAQPGARSWRRALGESACRKDAKPDLLMHALNAVENSHSKIIVPKP